MEIVYREFFSVRPDRVCKTVRGQKYSLDEYGNYQPVGFNSDGSKIVKVLTTAGVAKRLERSFHNFQISQNSQKNLRDKINYLYQFSKKRDIVSYSGKKLKDFRVAFITLTLPAKQKTPTASISSELFDPFLQALRQYVKMDNYAWRMEFQKNGNVHYHLVTDSYCDYFYIKQRWNTILEKHGYISDYRNKMSSMTWGEYRSAYSSNSHVSASELWKRYSRGKAEKWSHPNTVDVKNATSSRAVSFYISKYFSKKGNSTSCNELDNEENSFGLRLCFWSRSLSRCKADSMPVEYYSADIFAVLKRCKEAVLKIYDYCSVVYFDILDLPCEVRDWLLEFFSREMALCEYEPAS